MQWDFSLGAAVPRIWCWARLPGWNPPISPWTLLFVAKGRSPAKGSTYFSRLGSKKGGTSWRVWDLRREPKGNEGAKHPVIVSGSSVTNGRFPFEVVFSSLWVYQRNSWNCQDLGSGFSSADWAQIFSCNKLGLNVFRIKHQHLPLAL